MSEKIKSLREQILEANDLPTEKVSIPEWTDQPLYIRTMNGSERDDFERSLFEENEDGSFTKNLQNMRARLLARTLCSDKEGKIRIFTDADIELLGQKSAAALDKCVEASKRLSGISEKDEAKLLKNSKATQD